MTYDNDKQRDERIRHVPELIVRKEPEIERSEFEDQALDTSLKVLAASRHDGEAFLQRVSACMEDVEAPTTEASTETSRKEDQSFFGLAPSLLPQVEPKTDDVADQSKLKLKPKPKPRPVGKKRFLMTIGLASAAASMLVGFFVWQTYGSDSVAESKPVNGEHFVAQSAPEVAIAQPAQPEVREAKIEEPAETHRPLQPLRPELAEHSQPALEEAVSTPETELVAATPSEPETQPLWHFKLAFDESHNATAWIGKRKIQDDIPIRVTDAAFKCICHEVAKHVHYVSPILKTEWNGKVSISGPDFLLEEQFRGLDEMFESRLKIQAQFREQVARMDNEKQSKHSLSPTQSSVMNRIHERVIRESLAVTDEILKAELDPTVFGPSASRRYKNFRQLKRGDASAVVTTNGLAMVQADLPFAELEGFQSKATEQLKADLSQTPLFELFDSSSELKGWKDRIVSVTKETQLRDMKSELKEKIKGFPSGKTKTKLKKRLVNVERRLARTRIPDRQKIEPLIAMMPLKPELEGFDLAMGNECRLCESDAETLDKVSVHFGELLSRFDPFGSRFLERADMERNQTLTEKIRAIPYHKNPDQAIGTIDQMLQIENSDIRIELINALGRLDSDIACRLLACYVKYDVEAKVRVAATDALRSYPPEMCRKELLEAYSYPWPDAARHASEALVRLNDTDSVPELVTLLDKPDPRRPRKQDDGMFVHREMVAINHLRNCLLCHQDSHRDDDPGRGVIPTWKSPLPAQYYADSNQNFARVRADVTYLRQDFSLVRKVKNRGPWPRHQRFDYVVRTKTIDSSEADKLTSELSSQPNEYEAAISTAIRLLTNN